MLYLSFLFILFFYFLNYFNILVFNHIIISKLITFLVLWTLLRLGSSQSLTHRLKFVYLSIIIYLYFNFWQLSLSSLSFFQSFIYLLSVNKW